jgi:hypothetical protein
MGLMKPSLGNGTQKFYEIIAVPPKRAVTIHRIVGNVQYLRP